VSVGVVYKQEAAKDLGLLVAKDLGLLAATELDLSAGADLVQLAV
tara:strand:+ start:1524 stop:1658 length:135 start_codon:yes stop_codon:yes gene_type:complete